MSLVDIFRILSELLIKVIEKRISDSLQSLQQHTNNAKRKKKCDKD